MDESLICPSCGEFLENSEDEWQICLHCGYEGPIRDFNEDVDDEE